MKFVRIAVIAVLLAQPASAQVNMLFDPNAPTQEEVEKRAAQEKAYRESLKKIPDQKANDPWAGVRNNETPAPGKAQPRKK